MQSLTSLRAELLSVVRGREEQDTAMLIASSSNDTLLEHSQSEGSILPVVEGSIRYSATCGMQRKWPCERLAALLADWRTFHRNQLRILCMGSQGAGRTMLIPSMLRTLNPGQMSASEKQSSKTTDRLLSYEKHSWHDSNASMRDEDTRPSARIWEAARATSKASTFLMLAAASATVSTSWNNANNSAIIKSRPPATDTELCKRLCLPALNPNLAEFALAVCAYSIAVTAYAHQCRENFWQDQIILLALLTSISAGLWLGYDLQTLVLSIMSWAVIAALILSSASHELVRHSRRARPYLRELR
ncbi:hypothetical protein KCU85_g9294, partial [Aureobasidium melanogenum]